MQNTKEIHQKLLESLKESINLTQECYDEFIESKMYYEGEQLPDDIKAKLASRGQPFMFENMYALIGEKLLGYKINASTEMNAIGFQKNDRPKAEIITNIIKSITQAKDYQLVKQKCDLDLMCGICACEVWLHESEDSKDLKIDIKHIPINALYIDPYSQREDGLDSKYFHKVLYMDKDDAISQYGKRDYDISLNEGQNSFRERVRYFESFIYNTKTRRYDRYIWDKMGIFSKDESIFDLRNCPIVIRKLYIDSNNRFYGIFRNVKPHQDYVNFAENRMANMLGSQKILYEMSAVDNASDFSAHVSLDNAVVGVRDGALSSNKIHFQNHTNDIATLSNKTQEHRQIARMQAGFNDEALGQVSNRVSGLVVQQRTNAGLMGVQRFLNASDLFDKQVFSVCIEYITKYFDKAQVFRIVEEDTFENYFEINTNDKNKIELGNYDIVIETKAKNNSTREERFTQWVELIKSGFIPQDAMNEILPLVLDDSDSSVSNKVRKILAQKQEAQNSPQNQAMQQQIEQLQQQMQQLQMQLIAAEVKEKEAKAMKYTAQAQSEDIKLPKGER